MEELKVDICIIGAGSGGLSVAAGAVQMGASVVLIERDKMGGDCLNTGCVPSKALLASARVANTFRYASPFGIRSQKPDVDYEKVHEHVEAVINAIAPNDSVERFEKMGVKVIQADGRFINSKTVAAGDYEIKARRFVVATGSSAAIPPIPGLDSVDYLTNENIFKLTEKPDHLIIIGGGPIGCEMACAHLLLGCKVTVIDLGNILPKDEPELVEVLRQQLIEDGLNLIEHASGVKQIEKTDQGIVVTIEKNGDSQRIEGSHLLVAAGRKVNIDGLGLDKANIKHTARGIETDKRLRSVSNKKVFAAGDVAGSFQFTHVAGYHAGIIIRNILFGLPAKVDYRALPWTTYTEPELAHCGMTEAMANDAGIDSRILFWDFAENDRAQAELETKGKLKVITNKKGLILGCSIIGPHAGELILPWCLAIQEKLKIGSMASVIAPYPTLSEASKRIAGSYYTDALFSNRTKKIVRFIQRILP